MQKEKKQILLNTLALQIRESIPQDKAPSMLAAENGLSTSIMSKVLKGTRNVSFTTLFMLMEMCNDTPGEFFEKLTKKLPNEFTSIDI